MITVKNNLFHLATENTSYIFYIDNYGIAEHLYYGHKLKHPEVDLEALIEKHLTGKGNETGLNASDQSFQLENISLEFSTEEKGDYRTPMIAISAGEKKVRTLDLRFTSYKTFLGINRFSSPLPQALGSEENACGIECTFTDAAAGVEATFIYTVFASSDVITRRCTIKNLSKEALYLRSAYSAQLDLPTHDYTISTFDGAWARERIEHKHELISGKFVNESRRFASSSDHNPGIILEEKDGLGCYLINLIYSGAHRESVEVTPYGKTHILSGINSDLFSAKLEENMSFETPEAILLYSSNGRNDLSHKMHSFIQNHIQRGLWKDRLRPVVFNTWEACTFDFDEHRLDKLIKEAASLGFELFMLDDGWFGVRNDDTTSLGDWTVNTMKIPQGLSALSRQVHRSGMLFGLWIEPEMISIKSHLYEKHPEWMLGDSKRREHATGRNQYILDITRDDVQDYLTTLIKTTIQTAEINYIKWDMNRHISDVFSHSAAILDHGEYMHRYILSLYRLQKAITVACPGVMLENCAAGGSRFDLGMLAYASQIWTSDNSDPFERIPIIEGTSSLYPLSVTGTSVGPDRSSFTLRRSALTTRFEVAAFGCLSYSMDILKLTDKEKDEVKNQIIFYKQYRQVLQFGRFSTLKKGNITIWNAYSPDRSTFLVLFAQKYLSANGEDDILKLPEVDENATYRVIRRDEEGEPIWDWGKDAEHYRKEEEVYEVSGDTLKWAGIRLSTKYAGCGYRDGMRVMSDFSTRLYVVTKLN